MERPGSVEPATVFVSGSTQAERSTTTVLTVLPWAVTSTSSPGRRLQS